MGLILVDGSEQGRVDCVLRLREMRWRGGGDYTGLAGGSPPALNSSLVEVSWG